MTPDESRWVSFTDEELRELWEGLTVDDGMRYCVSEEYDPIAYKLASEMYAEMQRRGIDQPIDVGTV